MSNAIAIGATTIPALPQIDTQALAALGKDVSQLTRQAAQVLGATPESAARIGEQCLLTVDGMGVAIVPVIADATGKQGLLVTVFTERRLLDDGGPVGPLQHSPGLLVSFNATLGSTEEGFWTLLRWLPLEATTPQRLAEHIVVTRQLVDIVWASAPQ
jgi:hypothetical protein